MNWNSLIRVASLPLVAMISVNALAADETVTKLDTQFDTSIHPFLQTYCVSCHGQNKPEAELDLTTYSTMSAVLKDSARWGLVLERIKAEEMPPEKAKLHPTAEQRRQAVEWFQTLRDYESKRTAGDPGPVLARRLSNAEYDYTIRDLIGVDIHPTKEFPVDPANEAGFDNSGESLAMSPALVKKYLDAARLVSEHLVLKPEGFTFAPFPIVDETDRDKYAVNRIVDFYKRQPVDYANYFEAAWRFKNRAALGKPDATLNDFAKEAKVSAKYLEKVWATLNAEGEEVGPIAAVQLRWKALASATDKNEPDGVSAGCAKIRDFIVELRPFAAHEYDNFPARGVAAGSQSMVLWKDRQFADNRMDYPGSVPPADMEFYRATDPVMLVPENDQAKAKYNESFKRFCAVFPDTFFVSERARMFLTNPREIEAEKKNGGRLLSAGFHSQMGYFRDDQPLYQLVLGADQQKEIDTLWKELDFVTLAPIRQFKQFIWFERAEPPSYMYSPEFNGFRSEDDDIITQAKIKSLAEVYLAKAQKVRLSEAGQAVVQDYFDRMNTSIRALEQAKLAAEPSHLDALIALAQKAYRRPLSDSEKSDILGFYRAAKADGADHEEAVRETVVSILMSPYFSYRIDPSDSTAGVHALSDYALASRLSYFIWSSIPDAELLSHAAAGDLHQPNVLVEQTRRMLRDVRVRDFVTEFGGNWLDFRRFEELNSVDRERFPAFTNDLREAMFQEPIHFIEDVVKRNGSVLDFLYGDYTFVNPILAKHYGMPDVTGSSDNWVRIDDAGKYDRGGLLPMSVFLTKNAPGLRTSPVKRGYWVVRRLLGERIPSPPPNVPVLPTDESKMGDLTLRQALAQHRADKSCSVCHEHFDSVGVVFESFGMVGEVRSKDLGGRPVETSATFPDGSEGAGLPGLKKYLHEKREAEFVDNLCRKLLVYGLGRSLLPSDDGVIAQMREKLAADGYRFDGLIESIVTSPQFLNKRGETQLSKE